MRIWTIAATFVLLAFGLALTADRNETTAATERLAAPSAPVSPSDNCCGDSCECCDRCPCGDDSEPQTEAVAEDLSSHIGQVVERKTRPGLWEVVDAWRDDSGELMYLYRQVGAVAGSDCPGGVCPQPASTGYYDGTSGWTYPGDIASHLANDPNHMVPASELAGKTKDELEAMHDSLHDAMRSGGQVTSTMSSGCPGGVCPQPATRRRGLFRWR